MFVFLSGVIVGLLFVVVYGLFISLRGEDEDDGIRVTLDQIER